MWLSILTTKGFCSASKRRMADGNLLSLGQNPNLKLPKMLGRDDVSDAIETHRIADCNETTHRDGSMLGPKRPPKAKNLQHTEPDAPEEAE